MKALDKLRAYWSKREQDIVYSWPLGQGTNCDGAYVAHYLGSIVDELERRGYDPKTVKFSIEPAAGNTRFASQREDPDT